MGMELSSQASEELVKHTVDVLTVLDDSGTIQYESPSIERVLGYTPEELEGRSVFDYIHPDDLPKALETLHNLVESEETYRTTVVELRFLHKDGSWRWVEARGSNQMTTALEGYVVSTRDISERKKYEQQLKDERDRLDRFATVISHDLRNPVNVIQGRLDLAQEEGQCEHLDAMQGSIDRVTELIDDLLRLAQGGGSESAFDVVNLQEAVDECWQNLVTEEAVLKVEMTKSIIADDGQVKQMLENLFRNAIEHGGDDVTITVGELGDGFYVVDDGRGFQKEVRDSLLEDGTSTNMGETGFGLSIVHEIVENHNWSLNITDGKEGGARFEIRNVTFE